MYNYYPSHTTTELTLCSCGINVRQCTAVLTSRSEIAFTQTALDLLTIMKSHDAQLKALNTSIKTIDAKLGDTGK